MLILGGICWPESRKQTNKNQVYWKVECGRMERDKFVEAVMVEIIRYVLSVSPFF